MRTRHMVQDPKFLEKSIEVVILTTPIRLNTNDFGLEETLNMCLKLQENIKHIRFALDKIKPSKATISINETFIIVMTTDRCLSMTPYIRKTSSSGVLTTRLDPEKGS
jgi:hypothetical protein